MVAPLHRRSMLKNAVLAEYRDRCPWLEQQIGASGKHEIRGRISCLHNIPLKQGRVAAHDCPIDLCLPTGHDNADARWGCSHTDQTAAGEQRDGGL